MNDFVCFVVQLIPLYVCTAVGALGAGYYLLRLATRNPDVTWSRAQNPEPNQAYRAAQYKVLQSLIPFAQTDTLIVRMFFL